MSPPPPSVPPGFALPIVLGVDPGTRVVGYGAVVVAVGGPRLLAAGVLRPPPALAVPLRLAALQVELEALLARLRPTAVVVEGAFTARNVQSALRIGEGRGVVLACAARHGAEVVQIAPARAKKALVGNGAADKSQVARMVAHVLQLETAPEPHDATDALALALAHVKAASAPTATAPVHRRRGTGTLTRLSVRAEGGPRAEPPRRG